MNNIKMVLLALLMSVLTVNAQEASVENVLNLRSAKHSGQIIENNKLVGYFIFFTKEKVDKNNTAYEIEMFDDNYNPSSQFEIVRPKNSSLIEMVYNGSVFMLHFYDPKTGYEFVTFDRNGDQKGSNAISKDAISKWDLNRVVMNMQSATENVSIYPNGANGFIRSTFTNYKKVGYEIVAYDNEANEVWSYKSDESSDMLEMVEINDISANYLTATVTKKKNITTREMSNYLLLLNLSEGSKIAEIGMGDDATGLRSVLKSFLNESKKNITIVGEYYKPNDDIVKNKSQGLYMQEISLDGEDLGITNYAWKGDIDQFASLNDEDGKNDRPFYAFFHDVIVAKNGHIFLIGEQFLKQVSAGGIAMQVAASALGGSTNASAFEMLLGDMIVVEFDAEKNLVDFKMVEKKKTKIILPAGMGVYGSTTLGYYIKSIGAFDYSFTSRNKEKDIYDVIYIDGNRREDDQSEKSDLMVGVISIKGGKVTENRIPIFCESRDWWVQPGKPGYISVSEYYRKEKKIDMRLEKLTY
jgi:hypothetical protein